MTRGILLTGAVLGLLIAALAHAAPPARVLLVRSPDSATGNWGALPGMLTASARFESRDDGVLPDTDLSAYRLIFLSTNLNVFHDQRRRLWEFANAGGILVTWFPDDTRYQPDFWPYEITLTDRDPDEITFRDIDHPLLKDLRGKTIVNRMLGGDVVRDWDRKHWTVLAYTPDGPALLACEYGEGMIVDVQMHAPGTSRRDISGPLARNLLELAGVPAVDPSELAERSLEEVLALCAHRQMRTLHAGEWKRGSWEDAAASSPASGIAWSYPWGVTLYGLLRLSEVAGDRQFSEFVLSHNAIAASQYSWLDWQRKIFDKHITPTHIASLMRLGCLDDCGSMGSQVLEGLMRHGAEANPETRHVINTIAAYIHTKQSRFPDGSLCRGRTLWIDDLYMSVPFLARYGAYTGKSEYLDDAATQIINFASRLQDDDGLWFHGWFDREGRPSPYKWGRGNGWSIVSQVELLSLLPADHPKRGELLAILRRHIDGLKSHQAASGMWRQIVDMPDLWEETSCTGMFAYAIARAVNRGWIPESDMDHAISAVEALKTRVGWDGSVLGTCAGTGINRSLDYYRNRPQPVNDGHGPGPILLAGAEVLLASR